MYANSLIRKASVLPLGKKHFLIPVNVIELQAIKIAKILIKI